MTRMSIPSPSLSSLPRQLARTRRFTLGAPGQATVSPDGGTVFFLRTRAGDDPVSCLWAVNCANGEERLLADPLSLLAGAAEQLSPEERTRRERARELSSGIVAYAADSACELLARSEEHTSELQSLRHLVCSLVFEWSGDHRDLHSSPTRRSSDLADPARTGPRAVLRYRRLRGGQRLRAAGLRAFRTAMDGAAHQDRKSTRLNSS